MYHRVALRCLGLFLACACWPVLRSPCLSFLLSLSLYILHVLALACADADVHRSMLAMCDVLCAHGYLQRYHERYYLSAVSRKYMVTESRCSWKKMVIGSKWVSLSWCILCGR